MDEDEGVMAQEQQSRKAFKDWFDEAAAEALAEQIAAVYPSFEKERFRQEVAQGLSQLELLARVNRFSQALALCLPEDYVAALDVLMDSLPPALIGEEDVSENWILWPVGNFIAQFGLNHWVQSWRAMAALTQRFTAEFAVRPFVEMNPVRAMAEMMDLSGHESVHVRRWCSEGLRPRLPWGKKLHALIDEPRGLLPIWEALMDDESLYVRRSVANAVNDVAKDHSEWVVSCCRRWAQGSNDRRDWLIKHGLRSLLKNGQRGALAVMGFAEPGGLEVSLSVDRSSVILGESVEFTACLSSSAVDEEQSLMVDYVIHFVRQGGRVGEKVFKWRSFSLAGGESIVLHKKQTMRVTTVRALYAGVHRVELQVNGQRLAACSFVLKMD